jgi:hypothetical protein
LGDTATNDIFCFEFGGDGIALEYFGLRKMEDCLERDIG